MKRISFLLVLLALGVSTSVRGQSMDTEARKVSAFGAYSGYGEPIFDGYARESFYIPMRDGVELAVDLYRPTLGELVAEDPLPLVWTHDRYHRAAQAGDSAVPTKLFAYPWLQTLLHHGYLVAAVDVRGGGASFGTWSGIFNETETRDAYDIVEWFADQEWCDGKIGMYGGSYLGGTQFMAASTKPPHLVALFPFVAPGDLYEIGWSGGIYRDDLCKIWGDLTHMLDHSSSVASVEFDDGGELKAAAQAEHDGNRAFEPVVGNLAFRDSEYEGKSLWRVESPLCRTKEIEESGVAIYHEGGWFDPFSRDAFVMNANLGNPQKMVIGPWFHSQSFGLDWNAEALRWFDHWLKGVENGVMEDAPIHYFTMGAPEGDRWRATERWPLPDEERTLFYLDGEASGPSGKAGWMLSTERPQSPATRAYTVDYGASSGEITRWSNAVGRGGSNPAYEDLSANDARCMPFTTAALTEDVEVTGHPVAHLWVRVEGAEDGDFFLYLEEVTPDGRSEYVTEGCLRASHRALAEPPLDYLGLPYHTHMEKDALPLADGPMELVFDLFPVSNVFDAGNRIRATVACADDQNALTPAVSPAPSVELFLGGEKASYVDLPVIP